MQRNSQFMERLFTLIMTGAYGVVMVWLFISNYFGLNGSERSLLSLVTTWIQYVVFIGGVILIVLFFFLLFNFKSTGDGHHHTHDCDHDHDHANCDHDHSHDHHHEGHDHHHHDHDHKHGEGHDCCDHDQDHSWNPIRYIPLLIPLILIVMGLPDTKMIENFEKYRIDAAIREQKRPMNNEQMGWMMLGAFSAPGQVFPAVSFSTSVASGLQAMIDEIDGEARNEKAITIDLSQLEKALKDPALQQQYASYGRVEIEGMFDFEGKEGGISIFRLVRLRMACCLTDARPAMVVCITKKPIPGSLATKSSGGTTRWAKVQGRLKFGEFGDGKTQALLKASLIEPTKAPPFPYLN